MNFSENLQSLRKSSGISQEQLAERLGVSRQAVSKWETDGGYPETDKIIQLCDMFGVTMDELIKGRISVDKAEIRQKYDRHYNAFAKGIATGVMLIIAGPALSTLFSDLFRGGPAEALATASVLILAVAGIIPLIIFGIKDAAFKRANPSVPEIYTAKERERFDTKVFPYLIAGGVLLIFLGIIGTSVSNLFPSKYENVSASLMLFSVAAAVWLFIYGGIMHAKFDIKKYNRGIGDELIIKDTDSEEVVRKKRRERIANTACGVIMLTATAVYLGIGFLAGIWDPSWVVFPLCGIACVIVKLIAKARG